MWLWLNDFKSVTLHPLKGALFMFQLSYIVSLRRYCIAFENTIICSSLLFTSFWFVMLIFMRYSSPQEGYSSWNCFCLKNIRWRLPRYVDASIYVELSLCLNFAFKQLFVMFLGRPLCTLLVESSCNSIWLLDITLCPGTCAMIWGIENTPFIFVPLPCINWFSLMFQALIPFSIGYCNWSFYCMVETNQICSAPCIWFFILRLLIV